MATVEDVHGADLPDRRPEAATRTRPAFVHIGVGAFARAHLGVYVDDLMRLGHSGSIRGVSLRSNRAESQMAPQDCLYSVTVREPDVGPVTRIVGAFTSVETGADAAIAAISDPGVEMVTVTATEKAYKNASADASVDGTALGSASVDTSEGDASLPVLLARSLLARYRAGGGPVIVASLDNVLDNGTVLHDLVHSAVHQMVASSVGARALEAFVAWVESDVRFPRSVVDRMVPATTPADLDDIEFHIGVRDEAAVTAEAYRSWVIESVEGLPPLELVGVQVVDNTGPYERRKLHLLNCPHSTVAYCGLLRRHLTIADSVDDPMIRTFVDAVIDDVLDVAPLFGLSDRYEPRSFATESLRRFRNPALGHTCAQVGTDGSRKLAQRILPIMDLRAAEGLDTTRLATVVSLWLAVVSGMVIAGSPLPRVDDPASAVIIDTMAGSTPADPVRANAADGLRAAFGDRVMEHVPVITEALNRLVDFGIDALEVRR